MGCKSLAVITARGGSKRIPGKNIKEFCGKPILSYSIEAALESGLFDEVMVSTDSSEIAETAKKYGAVVPFMRSEKTSDDFATTADVLLEVFGKYLEQGNDLETACCLYPTAPFITADKLKEGREILSQEGIDMVNPVVRFSFPPQRAMIINGEKRLEMKWIENRTARSQDLEPFYHDCGQFYWYDVKYFVEHNGIMDGHIAPLIIDELYVQDIDNDSDWEIAEMKYKILKEKGLL